MSEIEVVKLKFARLANFETIDESNELIDIYSEFLFQAINNHREEQSSNADADARIILQMMFTKTLHLKSIINGISYKAKDGTTLNKIIDPTIVASLVRNLYETVAMFNLIYRETKSKDEKTILYCLWVHSGLRYRQRFESIVTIEENHEKLELEKEEMLQLEKIIESTELYKQLDEKNQNKIKTRLKEKEYLIKFDGKEVKCLHWQELSKNIDDRNKLLDNIYTYFSLYSHPSNVSVFQFKDMFKIEDEVFLQLTNFNLKYYFCLTSIFIADYINLFPEVLKTFEKLNLLDQLLINFHNVLLRGQNYSINDSWKLID